MFNHSGSHLRRLSLILPVLTLGACVSELCAADKVNTYLALGDSVAYGLDVRLLVQSPPPKPSQFTGYPEVIAAVEGLPSNKEINSSCPGETSGSFLTGTAPDYGCHSPGPQGQPPFKDWIGLHTSYKGSQMDFASSQLSANKKINLVTLGIGSNDVLLALAPCGPAPTDACANAALGTALPIYAQNLTQILSRIRSKYSGTLILLKYYSPSPALNSIAMAVNDVMTQVGSAFDARLADGYTAFQFASAPFGGDPCKAGLVVPLGGGVCDIHPTLFGQSILAGMVEAARLLPGN